MSFNNLQELLDTLQDSECSERRELARRSLADDSSRWLPQLLRALQAEDPKTRYRAAAGLAELGRRAREATPVLLPLLCDENEWVRYYACSALGEVAEGESQVTKSLCALVVDESWHVRQAAVRAIEQMNYIDDDIAHTLNSLA